MNVQAREVANDMAILLQEIMPNLSEKTKGRAEELIQEWKLATARDGNAKHTSLKECLREMIYNEEDNELDIYMLEAHNWPKAKDDEGEDADSLDMENYELIGLTDTQFIMACGGDWQTPMNVTMELVDGELTVTEATKVEKWKEGMDEDEFVKLLLAK